MTFEIGGTETLTATILPDNADNKNVEWSSSDENVATVTTTGVVTANAAGTATITVTTEDGGKTASCEVIVNSVIAENAPTVSVVSTSGRAGQIVDVAVEIKNNPGIAIIGFDVEYDSTALTLKSISSGEIFADSEIDGNIEKVPFTFNAYTGKENKKENGTLVTMQFEIKEGCEEKDYNIVLKAIEALNLDEETVKFEAVNGKITVKNVLPGDVTGDGVVNRSDLLRLAKYFAGHTVEVDQAAADVTGDGVVSRSDLLRLAKYFAGHSVNLGK